MNATSSALQMESDVLSNKHKNQMQIMTLIPNQTSRRQVLRDAFIKQSLVTFLKKGIKRL